LLPLGVAVRTEGGGGVAAGSGRFDLLIRSGGALDSISKAWAGWLSGVGLCTVGVPADDGVPVPVAAPVPVPVPPDIWDTMVRLWLLLNPVSFHFSETKNDRDLVHVVRRVAPVVARTCSAAGAAIGLPKGQEEASRLAEDHRLVGLAILLVHDHIDNRIDAGREVEQDVAADVQAGVLHILVGHLDNGDGQVADDEGQEDGQHHFGDAPLVPLGPHLSLILDPGRLLFATGRRLGHIDGEAAAAVRGDAIARLALRHRGQGSRSRAGQGTQVVGYGVLLGGMPLQTLLRLVDHPEDLGIAGDDYQAGDDEGGDEQGRLAAVPMLVGHNGAGLQALVVAKATPFPQQRGQLHAVGEEPAGGNHHGNPVALIDPGVQPMVGDHHVPIDRDHGDAQEGHPYVSVLDEGNQAAQYLAVAPGSLDEAETLEGQNQGAEEQIGNTEARVAAAAKRLAGSLGEARTKLT